MKAHTVLFLQGHVVKDNMDDTTARNKLQEGDHSCLK